MADTTIERLDRYGATFDAEVHARKLEAAPTYVSSPPGATSTRRVLASVGAAGVVACVAAVALLIGTSGSTQDEAALATDRTEAPDDVGAPPIPDAVRFSSDSLDVAAQGAYRLDDGKTLEFARSTTSTCVILSGGAMVGSVSACTDPGDTQPIVAAATDPSGHVAIIFGAVPSSVERITIDDSTGTISTAQMFEVDGAEGAKVFALEAPWPKGGVDLVMIGDADQVLDSRSADALLGRFGSLHPDDSN